jgi:hypothetical protein
LRVKLKQPNVSRLILLNSKGYAMKLLLFMRIRSQTDYYNNLTRKVLNTLMISTLFMSNKSRIFDIFLNWTTRYYTKNIIMQLGLQGKTNLRTLLKKIFNPFIASNFNLSKVDLVPKVQWMSNKQMARIVHLRRPAFRLFISKFRSKAL